MLINREGLDFLPHTVRMIQCVHFYKLPPASKTPNGIAIMSLSAITALGLTRVV